MISRKLSRGRTSQTDASQATSRSANWSAMSKAAVLDEIPAEEIPPPMTRARNLRALKRAFFREVRQDYLSDLAEDRAAGPLGYVVHSSLFDAAMSGVVALHVAYMIYQADASFDHSARAGYDPIAGILIESCFCLVYATELALKLIVEGRGFFTGPARALNVLDFILVVMGLFDILSLVLGTSKNVVGPMALKAFRAVRLGRLARLHRLFGALEDMRVLMQGLISCSSSIVGPLGLLAGCFLVMSLLIVQLAGDFLYANAGLPEEKKSFLIANFGSVSNCMFALYHSVTSGQSWMPIYGGLSVLESPAATFVYLVFHVVYTFLFVHVVLCMFLGKVVVLTLEQSQASKHEQRRQDSLDLERILRWCAVRYPGDTINFKDFLDFMSNSPHSRRLCDTFDRRKVTIDDTKAIMNALVPEPEPLHRPHTKREGDLWELQHVDRKVFFEACMRLKHEVTVTDIIALGAATASSLRRQEDARDRILTNVGELEKRVESAMRQRSEHQ